MNTPNLKTMEAPLLETWAIHNRIHLYLLDALDEAALAASAGKGRNVYALFAHMHNTRLMWIKASAPALMEGLQKLETAGGTKTVLKEALEQSGIAIAILLQQGIEAGGKIRGFKPHVVAYAGYMISHESHHRGQIEWALKLSGSPLPDNISYGLWEWGVR